MKLRRGLTAPGNGLEDNRDVCKPVTFASAEGKSALLNISGKTGDKSFCLNMESGKFKRKEECLKRSIKGTFS